MCPDPCDQSQPSDPLSLAALARQGPLAGTYVSKEVEVPRRVPGMWPPQLVGRAPGDCAPWWQRGQSLLFPSYPHPAPGGAPCGPVTRPAEDLGTAWSHFSGYSQTSASGEVALQAQGLSSGWPQGAVPCVASLTRAHFSGSPKSRAQAPSPPRPQAHRPASAWRAVPRLQVAEWPFCQAPRGQPLFKAPLKPPPILRVGSESPLCCLGPCALPVPQVPDMRLGKGTSAGRVWV